MSSYHQDDADYEYDYDYIRMTTSVQVPSAIGIAVLIILAIAGNLITIFSFATDKRLHTVYDFYIFNLAIVDLLIGCISMPFYAVYTLKEFIWDFGQAFCKVWLVIDFTICLESILLILLLSHDRLLLVTHGPIYSTKVTKRSACVKIGISWMLAFVLYGPAIISWDYWVGYSSIEELDCNVEFTYNFEYTTITALIEFLLPVVILAILNFLLYRKIRHRLLARKSEVNTTNSRAHCSVSVLHVPSAVPERENDHPDNVNDNTQHRIKFDVEANSTVSVEGTANQSGVNNWRQTILRKKETKRIGRESKAARVLAVLVIVFLICWAPYTIITIIISFCGDSCVNTSAYESMNWLLWGKSAINPFLYAFNSSRYRYNFKRILTGWKKNSQIHPETAETTCHTAAS